MSYTPPAGNAVNFRDDPGVYTPPPGNAVNFRDESGVPEAVVAFGIEITFAVAAEHGTVPEAAVDFTVEMSAEVHAAHGVASVIEFGIPVSADVEAVHGVVAVAAFGIEVGASVVAVHPRHVLKGEVRLGGVLVNRLIRAHRLDGGAVVGEVDTVSGRFEISAGWAPAEHYVLALDMSDGATDWAPPTANHLWSVMVED